MSIPNGKNVYGYAEAYAKLANFGQQHLLKYYDELDEAQRAALLNQIEQIDFSVVSTNKQPEKRGRITPIGVTELAEIRTRGDEFFDAGMAELRAGHVGAGLLAAPFPRCCLRAAWAHGSVRMLRRVRSISESSVNFIFLSAL